MMKKTLAMILAALMAACLAACSGSSAETTAAETAAAETKAAETKAEETTAADTAAAESTSGEEETEVTTDADAINAKISELEVTAPSSLGTVASLGEYKGIALEEAAHTVIDADDVAEYITENILPEYTEEVTDEIRNGDTANIDYEGKENGVAFEGGTSQGYDLEIGSGTFIDGFEIGLVGKKAGETVDLELTFPDDYSSEALAGHTVIFTVKINSVTRPKTLDDELAHQIDETVKTAAEYREKIRQELQDEQDLQEKEQLYIDAVNAVLENSDVASSEEAIEYTVNSYTRNYANSVESVYGIDFGTLLSYYGSSLEAFQESYRSYAEESVNQRLVLEAIAEKEGLTITDEDIENFAADYGYTKEKLIEMVGEELANQLVLEDKANALIVEKAEVKTAE